MTNPPHRPVSWKRAVSVLAVVSAFAVPFSAVAFDPFASFTTGDPLTAADFNERFARITAAFGALEVTSTDHEMRIGSLETDILYQRRNLPTNVGASGTIASLGFSGLTVGRTYRITLSVYAESNAIGENMIVNLFHGGVPIAGVASVQESGSWGRETFTTSVIFEATTTVLSVEATLGSGVTIFALPQASFTQLEELPHYVAGTF